MRAPYRPPAGPGLQAPAANQQQPPPPRVPAVNHQSYRPPADNQQHYRPPAASVPAVIPQSYRPQQPYRPPPRPVPEAQYPAPGSAVWKSELFSCFDDIPLCCLTCWCPCIVFGRLAEIVDKGATTFSTSAIIYAVMLGASGFQFVYSCSYRNKMRLQYGIAGDDFEDYCIHMWCESCALTQEYKELTARGYNLPLGWQVNMAMQKQAQAQGEGIQMPPIATPGMTR